MSNHALQVGCTRCRRLLGELCCHVWSQGGTVRLWKGNNHQHSSAWEQKHFRVHKSVFCIASSSGYLMVFFPKHVLLVMLHSKGTKTAHSTNSRVPGTGEYVTWTHDSQCYVMPLLFGRLWQCFYIEAF